MRLDHPQLREYVFIFGLGECVSTGFGRPVDSIT